MGYDDAHAGPGPLHGIRVLEISDGMAARVAGMLLAELGADVARIVTGDPTPDQSPEGLCWDRGKRIVAAEGVVVAELVAAADAVLSDSVLPVGCEGRVVAVRMPPYEPTGPFADLAEDPLLLAGLGGVASHHPAMGDGPVYPVVPTTGYIHGALGAVALVAGLLERRREGVVRTGMVTGLHASAAQMATIMVRALETEILRPGRALRSAPNFRMYRAADDEWFFLAALTPDMFVEALSALGCPELLLAPGIDGDPINIMVKDRASKLTEVLEEMFARGRRDDWLAKLAAGAIPSAPVMDRSGWLGSEVLRGNRALVEEQHPELGPITLPDVPIRFSDTPGSARPLARPVAEARGIWAGSGGDEPPTTAPPGRRPLSGMRVIDMASFLAAPLAASILADMGADVIRLEAPSGDPYRVFTLSYLAVNQRKRHAALDLRRPEDRERFRRLLTGADAVVENRGPHGLAKLGLPPDLREIEPRMVQCSVSAFGEAPGMGEVPGFDPVFQALSGMAVAQGGSWEPISTAMPVHDTAVGALGALGIVAALLARETTGRGQRVAVSLAMANTFVQSAELTVYSSRPSQLVGGLDYAGPGPGHRYYPASDGWVAVAARPDDPAALAVALSVPLSGDPAQATARELARLSVAEAVERLRRAGVQAAPVVGAGDLDHDYLQRNGFSHVVVDPTFGPVRVVDVFSNWSPDGPPPPARSVPVGADTAEVLKD